LGSREFSQLQRSEEAWINLQDWFKVNDAFFFGDPGSQRSPFINKDCIEDKERILALLPVSSRGSVAMASRFQRV